MSEQPQSVPSSNFFKTHLGWIVTGFLTLLFWMQTCNFQEQIKKGKEQITQLELDKQTLTDKVNSQGKTIKSQDVIITDNTTSLNNLTDSIFRLKRKNAEVIAYFRTKTNTSLVEVEVPYLDTTGARHWIDSVLALAPTPINPDSVLLVPQRAFLENEHLKLLATVRKQGLTIDSLDLPDNLQLRFLETKGGLFRSKKIEVQFFHSNPYVHTVSANSVFYKPKKVPFLKRIILPVAIGVGAGLLIAK
jgi:hypothetical protein